MKHILTFILVAITTSICRLALGGELTVLTYHDLAPDPGDDDFIVSRSNFVAQMDYLQTHDYQPVSLKLLEKVKQKKATLPEKAVLLTFDDGLKSYAQFAVPVLKTYGYPSVLSIVTGWVDGQHIPEEYQDKILSWDQIRELQKSPLVEIISHSHDLHTYVPSNPQGNVAAAGVTHIYSKMTGQYETEHEYRQRVSGDLAKTVQRFRQELKIKPIGITWPYGQYNSVISTEARLLGMNFQLTLNDGPNFNSNFPILNRIIVMRDEAIDDFESDLHFEPYRNRTYQFTEVSLDNFYGKSEREQEKLLSNLLDRLEQLDINTVILSPISKNKRESFFPTHQLRVTTDIMNRVNHQLNSKLGIRHIFLHLPEKIDVANPDEFYNDMSRLAWFNGVIFDGQNDKQQKAVRKIVEYYHPKSQFGHYGITSQQDNYDFVILPVKADLSYDELRKQIKKANSSTTKLFIQVKVDEEHSDTLPEVINAIRSLGIVHYGSVYEKGFYGSFLNFSHSNYLAMGTLAGFGG